MTAEQQENPARRPRKRTLLCVCLLLLMPFAGKAALWLPLTPRPVDLGSDLVGLDMPWMQSCTDAWWEGELPTWTPLEGIGRPLHSNLQAAAFYPPAILLSLLSGGRLTITLMELYVLAHLALAGIGAWWLARVFGLGAGPAVLAGVVFACSGFFLNHLPIAPMVASAAWLPFVLASAFRAFDVGSGRWVPAAALFLALSFLGGLPQPAYYGTLCVVLLAVYFCVRLRSFLPLCKLAAVGLLSFALAAPTLLPGLRELPELYRGGDWRRPLDHLELAWQRLLSIVAPQIGAVEPLPVSYALFFGTAAFLAALFGLGDKKLPFRPAVLVLAVVFLLIAGAHEFGLDPVGEALLPGYGFFKEHQRAGVVVGILGALLAAAGLQRLREGRGKGAPWGVVSAAAVIAFIQAALILAYPGGWTDGRFLGYSLLAGAVALLTGALLALPRKLRGFSAAAVALLCLVQLLLLTNTNNLREGVRESLDYFASQAGRIPLGVVPPRVKRRAVEQWESLDAYFGLNSFGSGDTNQYRVLTRLWEADAERPELKYQFATRYLMTDRNPGGESRPLDSVRLDETNRLQRFDLGESGGCKALKIRVAVKADAAGRAVVRCAALTDAGDVVPILLRVEEGTEGEGDERARFLGQLRLRKKNLITGVWVELVEGESARVKKLIADGRDVAQPPEFTDLGAGVFRAEDALPRALLVPSVLAVDSTDEMQAMLQRRVDLEERVILLRKDAVGDYGKPWTADEAAAARCSIIAYERHRVRILAFAPRTAFLVLSDLFHPCWSAAVDRNRAEVLRANLCARAVRVPPGRHVIEFAFHDPLVDAGLVACAASVIACCVVAVWPRRRK